MADFTALKTAIQNAIKQNGNEEITGNLLQEVLLAIVTTLGDGSINDLVTALGSEVTTREQADGTLQQNINAEATTRGQADTALGGRIDGVVSSINAINAAIGNGYVYAGIATPSSTPTTGKVFYLALTAGTYTNFGNIAVTQGINILKYNGSAWSLDAFVGIDDTPTPSSNNLVKSGGVFDEVMKNGSAFDLSAYNGGATYADLNAALTALNALPTAYKRGGMSMKFVLSSDNKYVQYRLMTQSFSTTISDWQGVDDEPTAGSENLVKSGGVVEIYGKYIENPEWVYAIVTNSGKILGGFKIDGSFEFSKGVPAPIREYVEGIIENLHLDNKVDKEAGKGLINSIFAACQSVIENNEFLKIETDSTNKILGGRKKNGVRFESIGFESPFIKTDSFVLPQNTKQEIIELIKDSEVSNKYYLPKYGVVDIVSEKFYLTKDARYSDADGVYIIQDYQDTEENATNKVTLCYYYIKSTLTDNGDGTYSKNANSVKLDFYAASQVTKIGTQYYVTSTLEEVSPGEYIVVEDSIEVTQIVSSPNLWTWPIDKSTEHYCEVEIDFGHFMSGTFYVGVKFQGSSTLLLRKKNLRFTFYKNNQYKSKDKIKLGEMLRQSAYNLKANWQDSSRVKESVLYRVILAVWENRNVYDKFPWNKINATPYSGATGTIKSFPIRVNVGGTFYGMHAFSLKKDKDNYCLKNDNDGIFVCGTGTWTVDGWEDELNDEMSESTRAALSTFMSFVNGSDYTRANMPTHMSIIDWIDYFICMQVFFMLDNTVRNIVLYSGTDKTKFYTYFYDLDLSLNLNNGNIRKDIVEENPWGTDMSVWRNFKNAYWDEIVNRYCELRSKCLNKTFIDSVFQAYSKNIPNEDYVDEASKWGVSVSKESFEILLSSLYMRIEWLDYFYFNI